MLTGCSSMSLAHEYSTSLINDDGKQMACSFSGFGIMSGNQAYNMHQQCVAAAQMNGFTIKGS